MVCDKMFEAYVWHICTQSCLIFVAIYFGRIYISVEACVNPLQQKFMLFVLRYLLHKD